LVSAVALLFRLNPPLDEVRRAEFLSYGVKDSLRVKVLSGDERVETIP
jgi:hypothetical protein